MRVITIAVVATLIMGTIIIAPVRLRTNVQAKPVANSAGPQIGPDHCPGVKFQFVNNLPKGEILKVVQVEYHLAVKNKWKTENVSFPGNGECSNGSTCTTTGDSLADSKGERLDQFKLHYQWREPGPGSKLSSTILSPITFPEFAGYQECNDNKVYGGQAWKVTK